VVVTNDTLEKNDGTVVVVVVVGMVIAVLVVTGLAGAESLDRLLVTTAPELHAATNAAMRNSRSVHPEGRR
jgi:hypothetical protein